LGFLEIFMKDLNRREFVAAAAVCGAAACLCGLANGTALLADTPATAPSTGPSTTPSGLDVGPKSSYTADGITARWMRGPTKLAIIRHDQRIYATTTICTHRGCVVKKADPVSFKCPCHGATYDIEGNVTKGPARVALIRYAISVDANGHVIVDKSKSFTPDQWDDPASFVDIS
jgi:Rieske Fe-S protein